MKCGVEHIGSIFVYPSLLFVIFRPNFLKLPKSQKCTKTGTTQPLYYICTWIMLHLVWHVEFTTFNDILCIHAHNFMKLGPVSPNLSNPQNTLKQVQLDHQMLFTPELSLIWFVMWSWTLCITFCYPSPWFAVFRPNFLNLS